MGHAPSDGVRIIGTEGEPQDDAMVERSLARTQTYAALAVAILVIATGAVVVIMDRPDDQVERSDWAFEMVQLEQVRTMGLTGEGVRVGIVDTGIDPDHESLEDANIVAWADLVSDRPEPYDDVGHGTAMASIIAGRDPLAGGVNDVELIIVKVVDKTYQFSDSDTLIADGIDFCLDPNGDGDYSDGADIISLSLGGRIDDIDLLVGTRTQDAITQAVGNGILVVAAAGNDRDADDVSLPGRFRDVICVGAVDERGLMAPFSSPGNGSNIQPDPHKKPELVAPGVDIYTAHTGGLYAKGSGTSHATAFTTAVLAAVLSGVPQLLHGGSEGGTSEAVETIKDAIVTSSKPLRDQVRPHDEKAGYGLIQAVELVIVLGY